MADDRLAEPAIPDQSIDAELGGGSSGAAAQAQNTQQTEQDREAGGGSSGGTAAAPTATGAGDTVMREEHEAVLEARIPAKKDASLREFLGKMDDYAPIVRLSSPLSLLSLPPIDPLKLTGKCARA